jgi:hypothetical protein
MTNPLIGSFEEVGMFRTFTSSLTDGSFALGFPKMINDLVFEYSHQPGSFRAAPLKSLVSLQCCEKSLLHGVFGNGIVTQSKARILEQVVTVIVQPSARVGS